MIYKIENAYDLKKALEKYDDETLKGCIIEPVVGDGCLHVGRYLYKDEDAIVLDGRDLGEPTAVSPLEEGKDTYIYYDGCSCSLTINDEETAEMDVGKFKKHLHKLLDKIDDVATLQSFFIEAVEMLGEEKDLGYCETCGSYNTEYKYEG